MRAFRLYFIFACVCAASSARASDTREGASIIDVRDFGAVGDGIADDGKAIRDALREGARSGGGRVYIPAGRYRYEGLMTLEGCVVRGAGIGKTVLLAADRSASALVVRGRNSGLSDLSIAGAGRVDKRSQANRAAGIFVHGARHFRIQRVAVTGMASVGIMIDASGGSAMERAVVEDCHIEDTMADGIHMTNGSRWITVARNVVRNTGDDSIAVVSYRRNASVCGDIQIVGNLVGWNGHGRGVSTVGGERVIIAGNLISDTNGAGIYIASEGSYNTYGCRDVAVVSNRLRNVVSADGPWHGGIHVSGRSKDLSAVGDGEALEGVLIARNRVEGAGRAGIAVFNGVRHVVIRGNRVKASRGDGIRIGPGVAAVQMGDGACDSGRETGLCDNRVENAGGREIRVIGGARKG